MRVFHFTEQPYPDAWDQPYLRVDIPNEHCDPHVASRLYARYLDEYMLADELGLNVMINEHHSTSTCLASSATVMLAILARQTKKARILTLGMQIANRKDPLKVAEELALVDVISGGRLEMGFVKGVPYEVPIANTNPVGMMERLWEAHDLILKAMTTRDGPFPWQGEHFQYRSVNIWPRPLQQPHPPVWITAISPSSAPPIAEKGHIIATVLGGQKNTKALFDRYRQTCIDLGRPNPGRDRFAYVALTAVGSNEAEARRRGEIVKTYLLATKTRLQYNMPPGYFAPDLMAMLMSAPSQDHLTSSAFGKPIKDASLDDLIAGGAFLCGTPDQVFDQIVAFDDAVGGIGNLILMAQAGKLSHKDTADSLTLFGKEVLPMLQEKYGDGLTLTQAA